MWATPSGFQPLAAAYFTPRPSASISSSRPYLRNSTLSPEPARPENGCVDGTKMPRVMSPSSPAADSRVLPHRVPSGHVADLVPEHAGQLRLVVQVRQDAARDVDEAAGQRERVDGGHVHDRELPGQVRALRRARQAQADVRHVALEALVAIARHRALHLGGGLPAHLDLLGLGHHRDLLPAGHRVGGAGGDDAAEEEGRAGRGKAGRGHTVGEVQRVTSGAVAGRPAISGKPPPGRLQLPPPWLHPGARRDPIG